MQIPITGIVFLPIIALVFLFKPSRLEELLICMAVFQGAAVINLGGGFGFGVAPYFFTAALLAVRIATKWINGRIAFQREEFAQIHLQMLSVFVGWCVVSAFILPVIFEGTPVNSPRAGAESVFYLALPLKWSFSNAGQAGYMLLNFFVLLAFADFCKNRPLERLINAFTYSGIIVSLIGLYQMISYRFGLPFPTAFFNSNGSWAQLPNQMIGGDVQRVSATFTEPSTAGGFLSGWLLFELMMANWERTRRTLHTTCSILGCVVLLATTSTTGYVTIGLVLAFMGGRLALKVAMQGRISIKTAAPIAVVLLVGIGFLAFTNRGGSLLDAVLWHKSSSSSATFRTATVWRAIAVMQNTYGLGAGLGSNRSFGTLAYIGSNLGVVGLGVFVYMLVHILRRSLRYLRQPTRDVINRGPVIACMTAFAAHLIGTMIAGAEISDPNLWVIWGMLLASVRDRRVTFHPQCYRNSDLLVKDHKYPVRAI
jgi:hypothetical protein